MLGMTPEVTPGNIPEPAKDIPSWAGGSDRVGLGSLVFQPRPRGEIQAIDGCSAVPTDDPLHHRVISETWSAGINDRVSPGRLLTVGKRPSSYVEGRKLPISDAHKKPILGINGARHLFTPVHRGRPYPPLVVDGVVFLKIVLVRRRKHMAGDGVIVREDAVALRN